MDPGCSCTLIDPCSLRFHRIGQHNNKKNTAQPLINLRNKLNQPQHPEWNCYHGAARYRECETSALHGERHGPSGNVSRIPFKRRLASEARPRGLAPTTAGFHRAAAVSKHIAASYCPQISRTRIERILDHGSLRSAFCNKHWDSISYQEATSVM